MKGWGDEIDDGIRGDEIDDGIRGDEIDDGIRDEEIDDGIRGDEIDDGIRGDEMEVATCQYCSPSSWSVTYLAVDQNTRIFLHQ